MKSQLKLSPAEKANFWLLCLKPSGVCSSVRFGLLATMWMAVAPAMADEKNGSVGRQFSSPWIQSLSPEQRDSILWYADYEIGNLDQWSEPNTQYPGGGVLNTNEEDVNAQATTVVAHSGSFAAEATIRNAIRAENGDKAVRLMRWATRAYDFGGVELPLKAYYSTWMYLPLAYNPNKYAPWDPGDGGWWNVFQFKSHGQDDISLPTWSLNIQKNPSDGQLYFYFYSPINSKKSWEPHHAKPIPIGQWFHVEAYVEVNSGEKGTVELWLDGISLIRATDVRTSVNPLRENIVWGIGNYTNHIDGGPEIGTATIYFDDSLISTLPVAPYARQRTNRPSEATKIERPKQ